MVWFSVPLSFHTTKWAHWLLPGREMDEMRASQRVQLVRLTVRANRGAMHALGGVGLQDSEVGGGCSIWPHTCSGPSAPAQTAVLFQGP